MSLKLEKATFEKNDDGKYTVDVTISDNSNMHYFQQTFDHSAMHSVYLGGSSPLPTPLKLAFHVAGLMFQKLFPHQDFAFVVWQSDCTPELHVEDKTYYATDKPNNHDDFESSLQLCLESIRLYTNTDQDGEKLMSPADIPNVLKPLQ